MSSIRFVQDSLHLRGAALALLLLGVTALPAAAQEDDRRFYAGAALGIADYEGGYEGLTYDDAPLALQAYGGYRVGERWSVELGFQRVGDIETGEIAGSGTDRLEISEQFDMAIVRALLSVPLSDLLGWRRKFSLFGTVGYHVSDARRVVLELESLVEDSQTREEYGLVLGAGVRYELGKVELRGYVEWLDLGDMAETWTTGVGVELRF
jgi:hypothetical protein